MLSTLRGLLISAAFVLLCAWALGGSSSFQSCVQQDKAQTSDNNSKDYFATFTVVAETYRDCLGYFVRDKKDEILVAFTAILAFSTIFLWVATRALVKSAERTAQRQLRAYVGVEGVSIKKITADEKPFIVIKLKNFGQTPAYDVTHWMDMATAAKGTKRLTLDKKGDGGRAIIDPTHGFSVECTKKTELTIEEARDILADTKRLYFTGRITYRDAFGHKRKTNFRLETAGESLIGKGLMSTSKTGNNAT